MNSSTGTITSTNSVGIYASGNVQFGSASAAGDIVNAGTIIAAQTGIYLAVSTFFGGITNSGTISAGAGNTGIVVFSESIFSGGISNSGTITGRGGIFVTSVAQFGSSAAGGGITNSGTISASQKGIVATGGAEFWGGIVNSGTGTITALTGIKVDSVSTFLGGVSNAGTIAGFNAGIYATGVTTFLGGISNAGTITVSGTSGVAIFAKNVSTFSGGITNSGTISAVSGTGIYVQAVSSFAGNIVNSNTISAGFGGILVGASTIFTGDITNTGLISSANAGILVGGTTTFAGAIVNSASGTIAAGRIGIGVTTVAQFGISSAGGGIVNRGMISGASVTGIGVFSVTTFFGGITNSGTISLGANAAGIVVEAATFSGNVSNSGTITGGKTGIDICNCVDTFSGHIVNSGTISASLNAIFVNSAAGAITIDQNAGIITGAIKLLSLNDTLNVNGGTINGDIVGRGAGGGGVLNFALGSGGSFTYGSAFKFTGLDNVNVNTGAVIVNGAGNTATNVMIAAGAGLQIGDASNAGASLTITNPLDVFGTLSGHGTITGDALIENGGTLLPGGSIGTLTITGNLTLTAGGLYVIEITPTQASKTQVNGTATLGGATVKVIPGLGTYAAQTYTILTSTNPLSGTFNPTVTSSFGSLQSPVLSYNDPSCLSGFNVCLSIAGFVSTFAIPSNATPNEQNVANAINNFILNGGVLPPGFQALAGLSGAALDNALDQLSGPAGVSFIQGGFTAGSMFLNLVLNPFNEGRSGSTVGPAIGYAPQSKVSQGAAQAFASVKDAPATFDQRFGFWASGYGGSGTVDPSSGATTTTTRVYGYASGLDYRVTPDTVVGFALGGGGTNWSLSQGLGGGHSDMFQSSLYASTHFGAAYLSGALAYSWNDVKTNRTVTVAGTDMLAGHFNSNTLAARMEAGYRFDLAGFGVTPYTAGQVQWMFLPAYGESATSGSNQFALNFTAQTVAAERTELGSWFDYTTYLLNQSTSMKLFGRAAWAHDYNTSMSATALFQSLPGASFVVDAPKPAANSALTTAGAEYKLDNGWSVLGKFEGEFSSTTTIYSGMGVIRKQW